MSLIYSALSKLELEPGAPVAAEQAVVRPSLIPRKKTGAPRWVLGVVAACILLVAAGWLAMTVAREYFAAMQFGAEAKRADAVSVSAVVPPVPVAVLAVQALPSPEKAEAPAAAPIAPATFALDKALAPSGTLLADRKEQGAGIEIMPDAPQAEAQVRAASATRTRMKAPGLPKPSRAASAPTPSSAASADEIDADQTNSLTLAITRAVQAGKNDEAEALLQQLGARLPAESITLLRLRAWHKMQSGDQAQAIALYRQIVARIPDDETAGINLTLLYWKAGQQDEARKLIAALAERHSDSETVQRYSRQLGAQK